jgi:polar amino acid transport system substrate-binding protein
MTGKTRLGALLATLLVALRIAGAASAAPAAPDTLIEKGQLTYGVAATFAPFEYQKDGKLAGFDIDMIGALSKKLGARGEADEHGVQGTDSRAAGQRASISSIRPCTSMSSAAEQVDFVPYLKIGNLGRRSGGQSREDHGARRQPVRQDHRRHARWHPGDATRGRTTSDATKAGSPRASP